MEETGGGPRRGPARPCMDPAGADRPAGSSGGPTPRRATGATGSCDRFASASAPWRPRSCPWRSASRSSRPPCPRWRPTRSRDWRRNSARRRRRSRSTSPTFTTTGTRRRPSCSGPSSASPGNVVRRPTRALLLRAGGGLQSGMRFLLVEDDSAFAGFIREGLRSEPYEVEVVADGARAMEMALKEPYDLLLLDVGLPTMSGIDVCRRLREQGLRVPILMLTARDTVEDKVQGLEVGADDYLTKPFALDELRARIRALL